MTGRIARWMASCQFINDGLPCGQNSQTSSTFFGILNPPIYAGAYVYGRRPIVRRPVLGRRGNAQKLVSMDQWEVLLRDRLPSYIDWEEYLKSQEKLRENSPHGGSGAVREGASLLAGRISHVRALRGRASSL